MTHAQLVEKTCKAGVHIAKEQTAKDCHLNHMVLGLAGEVGELIDAIKKRTIYGQGVDLANVIEELGDIEYYLEGLRQGFHLDRDHIILANIQKLSKRYEKGYSDSAAKARVDKQANV